MSYDLDILAPPAPTDDTRAWAELETREAEEGEPNAILLELHDRLTARYPCVATIDPEQVEESRTPWSSAPLIDDFRPRTAKLAMGFDRFEAAMPFIIETANRLGLLVLDRQTMQVHRGEGLHGFRLTLENETSLHAPTPALIEAAVDRLTPDGGPGFLILDMPSGDYVQVGGGGEAFVVEWRAYDEAGFAHWAAGEPGRPADGEAQVAGNGTVHRVPANERLSAADARTILRAFALSKQRPGYYAWRDMTATFLPAARERAWWRFWG